MPLSDFLKDLPTYNRENFSRIHNNDGNPTSSSTTPRGASTASRYIEVINNNSLLKNEAIKNIYTRNVCKMISILCSAK